MIKIIIQGAQGCGKTAIADCIEKALKKSMPKAIVGNFSQEDFYYVKFPRKTDIAILTTNAEVYTK